MRTITVTTPDNVEVTYRLAGAGSRCAAAIIDFLIQCAAYAVILFAAYKIFFGAGISTLSAASGLRSFAIALLILVTLAVYLGYFIISEMAMNGQSIGKKIFKLRVIQDSGRPINFFQSLLRNAIRLIIDQTGVGIVTILFSKKFKRVGDMVALTIVVAEGSRLEMPTLWQPAAQASLNAVPEASPPEAFRSFNLNPEEIYAIEDYFRREAGFTDGGIYAFGVLAAYLKARFGTDFDRDAVVRLIDNGKAGGHHV